MYIYTYFYDYRYSIRKQALVKKLLETNDESIIAAGKKIFKTEKKRLVGGIVRGTQSLY